MLTILLAAPIWIACSRHTGAHELYDQLKDSSLADINRKIAGLETVLLYTLPEYGSISSSIVRELISLGRDVTDLLPPGYTFEI